MGICPFSISFSTVWRLFTARSNRISLFIPFGGPGIKQLLLSEFAIASFPPKNCQLFTSFRIYEVVFWDEDFLRQLIRKRFRKNGISLQRFFLF